MVVRVIIRNCTLQSRAIIVGSRRSVITLTGAHQLLNNHIYSTLFKTQERESDRTSKEIEQRKESQKNTQRKQQGHVTLSNELQSTALTLDFPSSLKGLVKYFLGFDKICVNNWLASSA